MINLKPGDKIWLASAPDEFEQPTGPTVIFDLSEFGLDPMVAVKAYLNAGWNVFEGEITTKHLLFSDLGAIAVDEHADDLEKLAKED